MKNIIHLLFTCLPLLAASQENWISYSQAIKTAGHEGRRFRLEAAIRTETQEDSASAHLWARVDKEKGYGFFENMGERPVRSKAWKAYAIEGTIDTGSQQLAFGAWCQYNGAFFFDDVKLSIETQKDKWTTVFTDGFEAAAPGGWKTGVQRWEYGINALYEIERTTANPSAGKQCLKIAGSGVPNFGVNNKAGKHLDVNGIKLYCETYGEGQPLVILHTTNGSIESATQFIPEFAKKYKVIAFDNRGHGRSGDTADDFTYEIMADDIAKALDQLGVDSAFVWGFSDGAIQALLLAMEHPRLVKKLLAGVPNIRCDTSAIYPIILQTLEKQQLDPATDPKSRKVNKLMLTQPNIPFEKLSAVQCPVLVLAGDRDWVKIEHTVRIFQSIPKSQLCILPGSNHGAFRDNPQLFLQVAGAFFEKPFAMPSTVEWFKE